MIIRLVYYCKQVLYRPYEHMDHQEKFNETSSPEKKDFYNQLNMEDITDADYAYVKEFVNILK